MTIQIKLKGVMTKLETENTNAPELFGKRSRLTKITLKKTPI